MDQVVADTQVVEEDTDKIKEEFIFFFFLFINVIILSGDNMEIIELENNYKNIRTKIDSIGRSL